MLNIGDIWDRREILRELKEVKYQVQSMLSLLFSSFPVFGYVIDDLCFTVKKKSTFTH